MTMLPNNEPKTVRFGGAINITDAEGDGLQALEQLWWPENELNERFEKDLEKAKREGRRDSYHKRGLEGYVQKSMHQSSSQRYVKSVIQRSQKLKVGAGTVLPPPTSFRKDLKDVADTVKDVADTVLGKLSGQKKDKEPQDPDEALLKFSLGKTKAHAARAAKSAAKDEAEAMKIYSEFLANMKDGTEAYPKPQMPQMRQGKNLRRLLSC